MKKMTALLLSVLMCVQGAVIRPASLQDGLKAAAAVQNDNATDTATIDWTYWHEDVRKAEPVIPPLPIIDTGTKLMPLAVPGQKNEGYTAEQAAKDFGLSFTPDLTDRLISTETLVAFNETQGLGLDILTPEGFNQWVLTGDLSTKDIGIIGERTVLEADYSRALHDLDRADFLLRGTKENPKFYHPEQIADRELAYNQAQQKVSEAKDALKPVKGKWSATQLRAAFAVFNLLLAGYVIYNEGKNIRQLDDELEFKGEDANLADQAAKRYISATSITSAVLTVVRTFFPTALGIKAAGTAALTWKTFLAAAGQAGLLATMLLGAIYLTTTDEWKIHTQDWTAKNMSQVDWGTLWMLPGGFFCFPLWIEAHQRYLKGSIAMEMVVQPWQNLKTTLSEGWDWIVEKTTGRAKPAEGVGALKPNIYLYSDEETEAKVTFGVPQWLRVSDPLYEDSWQARVMGDGSLVMENGLEYGYLFYESETQPFYFQKETGWRICAESRQEQFRSILEAYGFNEKETEDFLEFWVTRLDSGEDYVMYPQKTEIVDLAMPLTVEPTCDSVFRLWFTFEKASDTADIREPEIISIERNGFTLVEWGGVILDD
ncbi:MAG: hypothetical protein J5744_08290 [Oscillospiraceae bacterium]|nr:hypothetical protein [Oscillospiraceae bacterium]